MADLYLHKKRFVEYFWLFAASVAAGGMAYYMLKQQRSVLFLCTIACVFLAVMLFFPVKMRTIAQFCFRHRWGLALILFMICLLFRLSGSSIGIIDQTFPTQIEAKENTLFGLPRPIRSDEYGVQTLKFFSQEYNDYGYFSQRMSLSETDMVLDYYSPVWNITAIGKPLMWGYLLFGSEIGLSWYWCGLVILLFMTALEMFLILTRRNQWISVLGAVVMTLSPVIQWYVMPHMPIVLLYAMALFCIGYSFFTVHKPFAKWGYAALAVMAVIGFAISIFPSFQVPCAYTVVALLAVCLRRDRQFVCFNKREWYYIAIPVLLAIGVLTYFVITSWDGLYSVLHTVYPGKRMSFGGDCSWRDLFTDLTSLYLPGKSVSYLNNCEVSTFIHFGPFFLLLFPRFFLYLRKKKSTDLPIGAALFVLICLCAVYMYIGIPQWLAQITLLRFCNRMKMICGWIETIFTIWGFHVLFTYPEMLKKWEKIVYPLVYAALWAATLNSDSLDYFSHFWEIKEVLQIGFILLIGEIVVFSVILGFATFRVKRLLAGWLTIIMLVAGATVNPIEIGAGAITNHPISQTIQQLSAEDPDAEWLCPDCPFYVSNFALANGARVLSATNFYPDQEKWQIIDPLGEYNECTNRYANQAYYLHDGEKNEIEVLLGDYISVVLTPETLEQLQITYLLSTVDYTELLNQHGIGCTYLSGQDGYGIYRLSYEGE